jgi:hypothetical protein
VIGEIDNYTKRFNIIYMKIKIEFVNPISHEGWDHIISESKQCSIFHSTAWSKVLSDSYNYLPEYLFAAKGNQIQLLIPFMHISNYITGRRGVSLPFTDYCEPIINKELSQDTIFSFLIDHAKNSKWKYFEIRGGHNYFANINSSSSFYGHTLELTNNIDQLFSGLSKNTKRNIKKAERNCDLEIYRSQSLDSMINYFKLHCITRKRHGLPPPPFHFFKNIYEHIISKNIGNVFLASYKDKIIGGAVYFHFGEKVIYKYGASDLNFKEVRPNNLIMWEAIKYYARNGYKQLDMGRTEQENEGLRRFKSGWGTTEKLINYYKYEVKAESFVRDDEMVNPHQKMIMRRIPKSVLTVIGSKLYKYVG